jgi:hypothetical protein
MNQWSIFHSEKNINTIEFFFEVHDKKNYISN